MKIQAIIEIDIEVQTDVEYHLRRDIAKKAFRDKLKACKFAELPMSEVKVISSHVKAYLEENMF